MEKHRYKCWFQNSMPGTTKIMPSKKVRAKLKKQNMANNESNQSNKSNKKTPSIQSIAQKIQPAYEKINSLKTNCQNKLFDILEFLNKTKLTLTELKEIETKMNYKQNDDAKRKLDIKPV